jgi:hypothetical protein
MLLDTEEFRVTYRVLETDEPVILGPFITRASASKALTAVLDAGTVFSYLVSSMILHRDAPTPHKSKIRS